MSSHEARLPSCTLSVFARDEHHAIIANNVGVTGKADNGHKLVDGEKCWSVLRMFPDIARIIKQA